MTLRPLFKTLMMKALPRVFSERILKTYYLGRLRAYAHSDEILDSEKDLQVVKHIVRLGDVVFDVGANFGFYTLYLSRYVGDHGLVYSIEPIPLTFSILTHGVKRLQLSNIKLVNCGV